MNIPKIAIIGRPNVGKSALFNRLCKKRLAIVHDIEGITRDRLYSEIEFEGHYADIIDTAGFTFASKGMQSHMEEQVEIALDEADSIILVVDGRAGVTELDHQLAKKLQHTDKPLVLAVNKIDDPIHNSLITPFYSLGIKEIFPISAIQDLGIYELLQRSVQGLTLAPESARDKQLKVALMGRTNVGKSTLLNTLAQQKRSLVDSVAGTTRDSIEVTVESQGEMICLIDTAGIRRVHKEKEAVEKFAKMRTMNSLEHADVVLLMLDVQDGLTGQEKRFLSLLEKLGKPAIFLLNKWDLVHNFRMEHVELALRQLHPFAAHMPLLTISGQTGRNVDKILLLAKEFYEKTSRQFGTGELNRFIQKILLKNPPPLVNGKRLTIYYMTQLKSFPPTFIFFINNKALVKLTYENYLTNQFRSYFGLSGIPIRFIFRNKNQRTRSR
jgi:GTP-binding protein